jgi:predicted Fe-Mo cluster-binding NifX family protein
MKVAVITDDEKTISRHFGRARYYVVITVEDEKVAGRETREKLGHRDFSSEQKGAQEHKHEHRPDHPHGLGAGKERRHADMIATIADCDVALARGMGTGIYHHLQQADIQPIVTTVADIDEAITAYLENRLEDHPELLH